VEFGPGEGERLSRLIGAMSSWHIGAQGQLRVLSWPGLLRDLRPLLAQRAVGLPAFGACVGCRWRGETEWATVEWDGGELAVSPERSGESFEVDLPLLTGIVVGGPFAAPAELGALARLLPVPVHIPSLDRV
jgi:hypothetical protein